MSPFDEWFEAMQRQEKELEQSGIPLNLGADLAHQGLRRKSGCPDDEFLCGFVDGQLLRKNFWSWFRVWLHVRVRRCRYCHTDVESLIDTLHLLDDGVYPSRPQPTWPSVRKVAFAGLVMVALFSVLYWGRQGPDLVPRAGTLRQAQGSLKQSQDTRAASSVGEASGSATSTRAASSVGEAYQRGKTAYEQMYTSGRKVAKNETQAVAHRHATQLYPPQPVPNTPVVQPRRALVIGNADYPDSPLLNPVNDATDLADILRRLNFAVTVITNANRQTMRDAVEDFTQGVGEHTTGLFFFAGHGVQLKGVNYLLPLGTTFEKEVDFQYGAIQADWILSRMEESGMEAKILILDACRNYFVSRGWIRPREPGLASMHTEEESLIVYATSPGKTAADGEGRNSLFTATLLQELSQRQRPIVLTMQAVSLRVYETTGGQQVPWVTASLSSDFYVP